MTQWRPIETAPRDGREVLVLIEGNIAQASWQDEYQNWTPWVFNFHGCLCCSGPDPYPTHWMPLPEPPNDDV